MTETKTTTTGFLGFGAKYLDQTAASAPVAVPARATVTTTAPAAVATATTNPVTDYLGVVSAVSDFGKAYRTKANVRASGGTATADVAWSLFHDDSFTTPECHLEFAEAARVWASDLTDDKGDFEWKMRCFARGGFVDSKDIGFGGYIVPAYARFLERSAKDTARLEAQGGSEWVGTPGKRETFTVTLTSVREWTSQYDGSIISFFEFTTESGDVLVWATSTDPDFEVGKSYTVKATVKRHDEYKGIKQTRVTRVSAS